MNRQHLALLAALSVAFVSCKKDEDAPTPTPTPTQGTVEMSFSFMNGTAPFDVNSTYVDPEGNHVRFTKLKFFVSAIRLTDDAGANVAAFPDSVMLVDLAATTNRFTLGNIDPAHVHNAHITIGLDSAFSYADPTLAPYPLNQVDMRWNWDPASGTIFLKAEGYVDMNDNEAFDTGEPQFAYHCIGAALQPVVRAVHIHADVAAGATATLAAKVDIPTLMNTLPLTMNHGQGPLNVQALQQLALAIDEVE